MSILRSLIPAVLLLGAQLGAQTILNTDNYASSGSGREHVVRDAQGTLYVISVSEDASGNRPLLLQSSVDGGQNWSAVPVTLNDASSGLNPPNATNQCALAIDDQGVLHALWAGYYYPSYYQQYYRNYDPLTGTASAVVNVGSITGATSNTQRTAALDIQVDAGGTVWIVAKSPSSWVERLLRSTQPYAQGLTFTDLGNISPSFSSQNTRIAVDAQGLIHCGFYRNNGSNGTEPYEHRIYDPVNGWQPSTIISNAPTQPHDYYGSFAADALGNVHALLAVDVGSPAATWQFWYRRWDATNGWGAPTTLFTATPAQYTNIANYLISDLACDAATGTVYAVYRDLSQGGSLRLAQKGLADPSFANLPDLAAPTPGAHEYYLPVLRGTLFPASNNTGSFLDITWQFRSVPGTPPYALVFKRELPGASISLGAAPIIGTTVPVNLSSPADPGAVYISGFAFGTAPGIPLSDGRTIPLNLDPLLLLSLDPANPFFLNTIGALDPSGASQVLMLVPNAPAIVGVTIYSAFVVPDATPTGIGTISPSLAITFQ